MDDLLPFYERELGFIRQYGKEFAARYPKIAGRLLLSDEGSQDPHIERLIESSALLSARISKKVSDDYPEFTEALMEVLYPHYLRPFPSCSIAQFDLGGNEAHLSAALRVPRGSLLHSRPIRGVACRFRTAFEVVLTPIRVAAARFHPVIEAPAATSLPPSVDAQISIAIDMQGGKGAPVSHDIDTLRLFADGEPSLAAALRDALALDVQAAYLETAQESGRWHRLPNVPLQQAGFDEEDALFSMPAHSHPGYRLLTELFAFPEKFGFFDLDLQCLRDAGADAAFTLHLVLKSHGHDSTRARLLEPLDREHVRLGCTPVVNLFPQAADPIRITHRTTTYPLIADARRAFAFDVHSVDEVYRIRQTQHGEEMATYRPFYSLHHGELPQDVGQYWMLHRDELLAQQTPGFETTLSFVDMDLNPAQPQTDVVSVRLTCTNRDLPSLLPCRHPEGDLTLEGNFNAIKRVTLLRKPSLQARFERGAGLQWRLISNLSLNHLSLVRNGAAALREMLRLYDFSRSPVSSRQIEGIVDVRHVPATAWLGGRQFPSLVRGVEIQLTMDETACVGSSIATFGGVLSRFFALYVHVNSFTQLTLLSSRSGETLMTCPRRSGESILV